MDKKELSANFKHGVEKVVDVSRKAVTKAGVALQDFSDKTAIKFEIKKCETNIKDCYTKLGKLAYNLLSEENTALDAQNEEAKKIIDKVNSYKDDIKAKEAMIKEIEEGKKDDKESKNE